MTSRKPYPSFPEIEFEIADGKTPEEKEAVDAFRDRLKKLDTASGRFNAVRAKIARVATIPPPPPSGQGSQR